MNRDRINEVFYGLAGDPKSTELARERVRWILEQASRGSRILDLGSSQGIVSILLAQEGKRVIGVDVEEPPLFYAVAERAKEPREVRARLSFLLGDGSRLPFRDGVFDTVVFTEVIEHLERPEEILVEIERVVSAEGRLILTTPFGLLPHPDHKRSYYPHQVAETLGGRFTVETIDVQASDYIRLVASKGGRGGRPDGSRLLELTHESFLAKEQRYRATAGDLRDELTAAREKYGQVTARYKELVAERDRLQAASRADEAPGGATRIAAEAHDDGDRLELEEARGLVAGLQQELSASRDLHLDECALLEARERAAEEGRERAEREARALRQELSQVNQALTLATARQKELLDEKNAYLQRYRTAVESFKGQKERSLQLDRQFRQAAYRLRVFDRSRAWQVIRLYWRFQTELLRGSGPTRRRFLSDLAAMVGRRLPWRRKQQVSAEEALEKFFARVAKSRAKTFVFMYSGTTYIQEHRGNRPIRLARSLLGRGVPVLFSYWRWNRSEPLPTNGSHDLLQLPIDLTVEKMAEIARRPLPGKKKIFVITFPHISCARFVDTFNANGWQTVYDVRDDWEEFHKVGQAKWYDPDLERYISNAADYVTAVSRPLRDKIQRYRRTGRVELSPNALDSRYPTGRQIRVRPVDGRRVIGYVGHLTAAWFNWEALVETARRHPDLVIEIVGHSMPNDMDLPANLRYLGPMGHREIRKTAARWRAALIPFKIGRLADGVDPIKVYEYLAMGLPVVSFRMPQIHDYPYVFIATDQDEFEQRIEEALRVEMDARVVRDFLAVNQWENRVDDLLGRPLRNRDREPDLLSAVGEAQR